MKKALFKTLSIFIILLLVWCAVTPCMALSQQTFDEKLEETCAYLQTLAAPSVGSIGGEWRVLGLARNNSFSEKAIQDYYQNVETVVSEGKSDKLNSRKSTDNSRVILALSAIGKNAASVAGYNLTAPLNDISYVKKQGINGAVWALLALDCCQYPANAGTRDALINEILDYQQQNGSWGLDTTTPYADITAMALQSLAPYYRYDISVQGAVDNALTWLAENSDYFVYSPETDAQIIVALTSLGIDPASDSRFAGVLDGMMRYSVQNGFEHEKNAGYNQMATEQAFYAMTAYKRFQQRKTSLYNMTDVMTFEALDFDGDGRQGINDATYLQRYLADFDVTLYVSQKKSADLNRNGRVDIGDVTLFQRLLAQ